MSEVIAPKPVRFDPNSYFNINLKADLERAAEAGMTKIEAIKFLTERFKISAQSCRVVINHHGLKFREPNIPVKVTVNIPRKYYDDLVSISYGIPIADVVLNAVASYLRNNKEAA